MLYYFTLGNITQVAIYQKPSQNKLKTAYLSAKQRFFCIKI
jgi:hypothetical protein